jgi:hypothetical protein
VNGFEVQPEVASGQVRYANDAVPAQQVWEQFAELNLACLKREGGKVRLD